MGASPRLTVHDLKRRTPSADELVAEARAIVPSRLPRWRRVRVAHHEIDRVRRIDMLLAFGGSLVFPLAGLLATLRAGIVGAVAVTAAFLAAEGAAELAFGRGTFQAVRRRVLPRLVAAEESLYEDLEPDDAPSPSGAAAGSLFVAIVGALVLLWSRVVPESPPSPAWFTVVWAVVATSHLARASAELRALHDWVVPERESK